ncbi:MAG: hypothetical protein DLM50_04540 [Candidatus Meridianibacter frigidus]|nr:MAG: hypothetical protein DLM50_04540 [Candidatus Eremiobacteraeota bacterium]
MKRSGFLLGTAALAVLPRYARASSLQEALADRIRRVPGTAGVYVRTMQSGPALFTYNTEESFPAASTIKMLIMLTAFHREETAPGSLQAPVRLRSSDFVGGSPYLARASAGETYTVAQLVTPMITLSDNSAANALITHFGFDAINASARRAGLSNTYLRRHFLDYSAIVHHHENVTTAGDMGRLLFSLERGAREEITTVAHPMFCRRMVAIMLHQTDRDKIPAGLPAGTPVANKTGEVDGVRNDIAIVDPFGDSPFVLTVFTKNLSSYELARRAIAAIASDVFNSVAGSNL